MTAPSADRDLVLAAVALQLELISRDVLVAAARTWAHDPRQGLGPILVGQGHVQADSLRLLDALVDDLRAGLIPGGVAAPPSPTADSISSVNSDASAPATDLAYGGPVPPLPPAAERPRFRVVRFHARGGLGEVFVADDAELGRQVALKTIRPERADDPANRQRFVREAEVTGGLEHPGVVPVYSLGASANGRPYYAMRLVPGDDLQAAIRRFHAAAPRFDSLPFRDLLGRFVQVCNAIAYAHSRGVLHRDLKPANVMLGNYGETYVVDWGLAKAVGQADTPASKEAVLRPRAGADLTEQELGKPLGTPAYMSPEQATGRTDDLGTATDVYGLGATLYELLTGRTAFAGRNVLTILEDVEAGRFLTPRATTAAVPPALDAICRKAMALRPEDRYDSALALADDVTRYLADEPVQAYREPWAVRARRWARRHRPLVTGAAALLVTAVAALAVASVLLEAEQRRTADAFRQAVTNEATARRQQERAEAYLVRMRRAADDFWLTKVHDQGLAMADMEPAELQQMLFGSVTTFYGILLNDGSADPRERADSARTHSINGLLDVALGKTDRAEANLRQAVDVYRGLVSERPGDPDYRHRLALATYYLGLTYEKANARTAESVAMYRDARARWQTLAAEHPAVAWYRQCLGHAVHNLAVQLAELGPGTEAEMESLASEVIELRSRLVAEAPNVHVHQTDLATSRNKLGWWLFQRDRNQAAAAEFRAAAELRRRVEAGPHASAANRRDLAAAEHNLGLASRALKDTAAATAAFTRARDLRVRLVGEDPTDAELRSNLAWTRHYLGYCLAAADPAGAEVEHTATRDLLIRLHEVHPAEAEYRVRLSQSWHDLGLLWGANRRRQEDAIAAYRAAIRIRESLAAEAGTDADRRRNLAYSQDNLGLLLLAAGKPREAESAHRLALPLWEALAGAPGASENDRSYLAFGHACLAEAMKADGRPAEAAASFRAAAEANDRLADALPATPAYRQRAVHARLGEAECLVAAGDTAAGVAEAASAVATAGADAAAIYAAARIHARAAAGAEDPLAARAADLLRQAVSRDFADVARLLSDDGFAKIRGRADYVELLWDLADRSPAGGPPR